MHLYSALNNHKQNLTSIDESCQKFIFRWLRCRHICINNTFSIFAHVNNSIGLLNIEMLYIWCLYNIEYSSNTMFERDTFELVLWEFLHACSILLFVFDTSARVHARLQLVLLKYQVKWCFFIFKLISSIIDTVVDLWIGFIINISKIRPSV
jgi:hypothetical protein